ncbi:hypothetical protein D9619_009157 [Psilocybe cf. subviscida]|uniref:TNase-like domain-containing protein n=1 Tax=Psilocybe cf. subviscida TaxID=2480587 RepID=A0A8H5BUY0_9AGAR|nr:hypothetical protein D9619_009157 [Psilocybe cf. subviscida]
MAPTSWIPWAKKQEKEDNLLNTIDDVFVQLIAQFEELPTPVAAGIIFGLGSVATVSTVLIHKRYAHRVRNSDWVTPTLLTRKRWLKGVVTSVGDGDNFRFFHTPTLSGYSWPFKFRRIPSTTKGTRYEHRKLPQPDLDAPLDLKDETLHIRLAGVDAPEAAHFGKPAQPYAAESLTWLRETILGKTVFCQLLRKDQYSRVVAQVYLAPRILPSFLFYGKNLPTEMLKAGWAVTYEQAGAEYGRLGKEGYLRFEAQAKASRRGMWKKGTRAETPAEYKRRHAAGGASAVEIEKNSAMKASTQKSWLRKLLPW